MKKRSKLYIGISIIFVIIVGLGCYSYHWLNSGVPRTINVQKYHQGEVIKLDDFELTVNDIAKNEDDSDYIKYYESISKFPGKFTNSYTVNLTMKNVSDEDKSVEPFYYKSFFIYDIYRASVPLEGTSDEVNSLVKSKEEKNIKLTFSTQDEGEKDVFEFYPPKELYSNEIKSDLEDLKMCEKYIELHVGN